MDKPEQEKMTLDHWIRRIVMDHEKPYYDWLRHIVTLSMGSLTGLVALQGHYMPYQPTMKWALATCWISLLASILLGLLALTEEYQGRLRQARRLQEMWRQLGHDRTATLVNQGRADAPPSTIHKWALRLLTLTFPLALSALCLFATANLLRQ